MAKRKVTQALEKEHTEEKRPYPGPFRTKGEFEDEITLRFDDEKELYVSATFLKMMSPVFKTMLESDFKEKKDGVVSLREKKYEHFLALLEAIHPSLDKPITDITVFAVLPLAHEYQVISALRNCKTAFLAINIRSMPLAFKLKVLKFADVYDLKEVREAIINDLKTTRSTIYNPLIYTGSDSAAFKALSDSVKVDLLLARLAECD